MPRLLATSDANIKPAPAPTTSPATLSSEAAKLEETIRVLDGVLDATMLRLEGQEAFQLMEEVRAECHALRDRPSLDAARRLQGRLASLELGQLRSLIRAFSLYFDLINLAEQQARIRALRARAEQLAPVPIPESFEASLVQLAVRGLTDAALSQMLSRTSVVPVFTAHPSEARRRTILEKLDVIGLELERLEYARLSPAERAEAMATIAAEVEVFWLTDAVRETRPKVIDEIRHGLGLVSSTLFEIVPKVYRTIEAGVSRVFPASSSRVPTLLKFGTWIGGDRDGNPHVGEEATREAVRLHQETVLRHYLDKVMELGRRLSHSKQHIQPHGALLASLAEDRRRMPEFGQSTEGEPYRQKFRYMTARLRQSLDHVRSRRPRGEVDPNAAAVEPYLSPSDLRQDLAVVADDLDSHPAGQLSSRLVRDLIREVDVFGLHLLTLDIRQHSFRHTQALDEILRWGGVCENYAALGPQGRFELLQRELAQHRPLVPSHLPFSAETIEVVRTFRTVAAILEEQCAEAIDTYIISGTSEAAHLLEVLLLAREARLFRPEEGLSRLNIVPLFEALAPLADAASIMRTLLAPSVYRQHLALRGNLQEIMLGYSDSGKEAGSLQSAWAIYKTHRELAGLIQELGVTIQFMHGRGGSIGRGGGPANQAILAQPPGPMNLRIRFTEQGEVIADRYGRPAIAARHLEQILNAVLLASQPADQPLDSAWEGAMERLATSACAHYQHLVYQTPEFIEYFEQATPFEEITHLKIASRPAYRGATRSIRDIRAIPWVFSWMQSRHTLPGWYGIGSAISDFVCQHGGDMAQLREMYRGWPFWRTLVDNTQMIMAKADLTIARLYADLVSNRGTAERIFRRIEAEFHATTRAILEITGQSRLLDNMPVLQRSIERRNPYVDPLSYIQQVLLQRLRSGEAAEPGLMTACLESINGIASGLKNTG